MTNIILRVVEAIAAALVLFELYKTIHDLQRKKPHDKARTIRSIVALVLLIAVFVVVYSIDENKTVILENYKELSQEEAVSLILDQKLEAKINEEYCYNVSNGIVFDQTPVAGTELRKGETIQLYVSLGPKPVVMPDYLGMTEKTARTDASKYNFSITTKTGYNSTYKEGTIYKQEPEPLSNCFEGDAIVLYVSKGGEPKAVRDYIGMSKDQSIAAIRSDSFTVKVVEEYNDEIDDGVVFNQSPKKGNKVSEGSTITIYVSKGHSPVVLDNYIGQEAEAAKDRATELGLNVILEEVANEDYEDGTVFDQSPKADTEIAYGGKLTLYVAINDPFPSPFVTTIPANQFTYCSMEPWDSKKHKNILGCSKGSDIKISITDFWNQIDGNTRSDIIGQIHFMLGSRFDFSLVFSFIPSEEMRGNRSFAVVSIIADGEVVYGGDENSNRLDSSTTKALETTPISLSGVNELIIQFDCKVYDGKFAAGIALEDA